jgi:MFS family permease
MIIFITSSGNFSQLITGRFIMGMGIGQAGIVGLIYLAEVAPKSCRGLLVVVYASSEYIGVLIGVCLIRSLNTGFIVSLTLLLTSL